jgi:hypothetical protein
MNVKTHHHQIYYFKLDYINFFTSKFVSNKCYSQKAAPQKSWNHFSFFWNPNHAQTLWGNKLVHGSLNSKRFVFFFVIMITHGDSTCSFVDVWGFNFQTINFTCGAKKSKVHLGFLCFGASIDVWGQQFTSFMKFMVVLMCGNINRYWKSFIFLQLCQCLNLFIFLWLYWCPKIFILCGYVDMGKNQHTKRNLAFVTKKKMIINLIISLH